MAADAIAVLGGGSWGTALAISLAANGHQVRLWGHRTEHIQSLAEARENRRYLPGIPFPDSLTPEPQISAAIDQARVLVVVPSFAFRKTLELIREKGEEAGAGLCWATKGFDPHTSGLLSDVARDVLGDKIPMSVVSGPSFANEVASGMPTAITVASNSEDLFWPHAFRGKAMRVYRNDDMVGVQVGGAVKNVIAVATGVSDGLGFGANARAALITRGLAEVSRLGIALGAKRETLMGLAGLGDLVLTSTDDQSRNRRLGLGLGAYKSIAEIKQEIGQEIEGIHAVALIMNLAQKLDIDMPITLQVKRIIDEEISPQEAVNQLLSRDVTYE